MMNKIIYTLALSLMICTVTVYAGDNSVTLSYPPVSSGRAIREKPVIKLKIAEIIRELFED